MMTDSPLNRAYYLSLDLHDPLAAHREQFDLPADLIYLDGNSLGALPRATPARLAAAITQEWGDGLIRSWNTAGWYELPRRVGAKIAQLIGAQPDEVIVADSTSVNLFKVLSAALALSPERRVILSETHNFPTDLYIAQGLIAQLGGHHELRLVDSADIPAAIDTDTAVVYLTHVNYRSGLMYDMREITAQAHHHGALTIWDLAHSAGAVPVTLNAAGADFAVGCGYKYLNGGPGAPAFLYVAHRHQASFVQPLSGWMGHTQPFAFHWQYQPAEGVARYLCGTQPVLSMTALECGIDTLLAADMTHIRDKSVQLTELFIRLVETRRAGFELRLASPRESARRGSQVCWQHPEAYAIMQALIARGVIGDFRAPDILRFGFTPLYTRYVDVWDTVTALHEILAGRLWDQPQFKQRAAVT
jgi:kynureninase